MNDDDPNDARFKNIEDTLDRADTDLTRINSEVNALTKDNAELRSLIGDLAKAILLADTLFHQHPPTIGGVQDARTKFNALRDRVTSKTRLPE